MKVVSDMNDRFLKMYQQLQLNISLCSLVMAKKHSEKRNKQLMYLTETKLENY